MSYMGFFSRREGKRGDGNRKEEKGAVKWMILRQLGKWIILELLLLDTCL